MRAGNAPHVVHLVQEGMMLPLCRVCQVAVESSQSERERVWDPPSLLGSSHKTRHPSNLHPAPFDDVNDARVYGFSSRENWIREDFSAPSHHREVPRGAPEMIIQNEMDVKCCSCSVWLVCVGIGVECMMGPGSANGSWTWHGGEHHTPYLQNQSISLPSRWGRSCTGASSSVYN
jgi:hypothetical protein